MNKVNNKDIKDTRLMFLRQVIILPLRFARSLIILPLLPQSTVFLLKVISTWFGYVPRLMFGTNAVLGFYYPAAEKKGDIKRQNEYITLSWYFSLFTSFIGGAVGIIISIFYLSNDFIPFLFIWGMSIASMAHINSSLFAKGKFNIIAKVDVFSAISNFVFPLIGWFLFKFIGYVAGSAISFIITIFIARQEIFPKVVKLSRSFITNNVFKGIHFWFNGFLQDLAKSFEITMLIILPSIISKEFGGQYAVAMTLATILNQLIVSISMVMQRKLTTQLSEDNNKGIMYLLDYMVIDIIVFIIFYFCFISLSHILMFFVPKYYLLEKILAILMFGVFFLRLRYYPGLAFKIKKRFWQIHWGHIVHLVIVILVVILFFYKVKFPRYLIAISQLLGALLGTLIVLKLFLNENKGIYKRSVVLSFLGWIILLLTIPFVHIVIHDIFIKYIIELVISTVIVISILIILPRSYEIIKQLIGLKIRRF